MEQTNESVKNVDQNASSTNQNAIPFPYVLDRLPTNNVAPNVSSPTRDRGLTLSLSSQDALSTVSSSSKDRKPFVSTINDSNVSFPNINESKINSYVSQDKLSDFLNLIQLPEGISEKPIYTKQMDDQSKPLHLLFLTNNLCLHYANYDIEYIQSNWEILGSYVKTNVDYFPWIFPLLEELYEVEKNTISNPKNEKDQSFLDILDCIHDSAIFLMSDYGYDLDTMGFYENYTSDRDKLLSHDESAIISRVIKCLKDFHIEEPLFKIIAIFKYELMRVKNLKVIPFEYGGIRNIEKIVEEIVVDQKANSESEKYFKVLLNNMASETNNNDLTVASTLQGNNEISPYKEFQLQSPPSGEIIAPTAPVHSTENDINMVNRIIFAFQFSNGSTAMVIITIAFVILALFLSFWNEYANY